MRWTRADDALIVALWRAGHTSLYIGRRVGCSPGAARRRLRRLTNKLHTDERCLRARLAKARGTAMAIA